jgi:hypothetical protein
MRAGKLVASARLVSLTCLPLPARAAYKSGNDLYSKCTATNGTATYYQDAAYCIAYVTAVYDALSLDRMLADENECLPDSVTAGQLKDVALAYIRTNPKLRHLSAAALVRLALADAWPTCVSPK